MFQAAKDIWYPYIYRSIASKAEKCTKCTESGKNLKNLISKQDMGQVVEPKEPKEAVQFGFWGPFNYLNESRKNGIVAVDRFSLCPSAMVFANEKPDKILKLLRTYNVTNGVPRINHIDQGTNFTSNEVKRFCNTEGIEIVESLVNNNRATGCVERLIGTLKNSILTYAKEENPEALGRMLERALGALRFSINATAKPTPFEAHHAEKQILF